MNKIKKKLNSNNGVSILFALLLFLVVSMVSVTILAASYSSLKRTHATKVDTQNILALDSASMLLKEGMDNAEYVVTENEDGQYAYDTGVINGLRKDSLNIEIQAISIQLLNKNIPSTDTNLISIEAQNMPKVNISYSIQTVDTNKYIVVFKLETEDAESNTYVKFNAECEEHTASSPNTKSVIWTFFKTSGKKSG